MYSTFVKIGDLTYFYVLVANLTDSFELRHDDIDASPGVAFFVHDWSDPNTPPRRLSAPLRLNLPKCGTTDFHLFVLSPIEMLGERSKFVSVSRERFQSINGNSAKVILAPEESIVVTVFGKEEIKLTNTNRTREVVEMKW